MSELSPTAVGAGLHPRRVGRVAGEARVDGRAAGLVVAHQGGGRALGLSLCVGRSPARAVRARGSAVVHGGAAPAVSGAPLAAYYYTLYNSQRVDSWVREAVNLYG